MSTRLGKIARLPLEIREELNRRLRAGALGPQLLPWLNGLPEVRAVLEAHFGNKDINAENLSAWRTGGFAEWEDKQDRTYRTKELAAYAVKLAEANGASIAQGASALVSGRLLELLEAATDADKKLTAEELQDVVSSLTSLRSAEIAQQRADLDREKLKRKDEEIALAKAAFEQRLTEYQDKVAEQKRTIESALGVAKAGGMTPETLQRIEEAARLL